MNRKFSVVALALAALVVAFLGLRLWMAPPPPPPPSDFSRAGNDGGARPANVDRDVVTRVSNRGNPYQDETHTTLNCDVVYKLGNVSREPAACAGYRFANAIARAQVPILLRINELRCPEGCTEKVSRFIYVKTDCRNDNARVDVKAEVMCRKPGGPAWTGINVASVTVTASTETAIPGENGGMDPTERRAEYTEDVALRAGGPGWSLTCPQSVTFAYRYEEFDRAGCGSITDYKPVVDRAIARFTATYYNGFTCAGPCTKRPLVILRKEWSCDGPTNNVVVKIWATVECRQ